MPLYEYECDDQGHRFERIQKFADPPVDKCPECGSPVHKLMSSPAIQFKGSGWYITDYAKGGKAGSDSKAGAKSEGKADAKAETAAETKTEAKPDSSSGSKAEPKASGKPGGESS